MGYVQTANIYPYSHLVESLFLERIDKIIFGPKNKNISGVVSIDDLYSFTESLVNSVYSINPYLSQNPTCNIDLSQNCTNYIFNQSYIDMCHQISEFSGYSDHSNRQISSLILLQRRRKMTSCDNIYDPYFFSIDKSINFSFPERECFTDELCNSLSKCLPVEIYEFFNKHICVKYCI